MPDKACHCSYDPLFMLVMFCCLTLSGSAETLSGLEIHPRSHLRPAIVRSSKETEWARYGLKDMIQAADDAKYKMERVEKVWAREELKKKKGKEHMICLMVFVFVRNRNSILSSGRWIHVEEEWKGVIIISLSRSASPPQRIIRWCRDGRQAQAEDWLGSHSSGTSKPQALTVSIPKSDRDSLWCAGREGERYGARAEGDWGGKREGRGLLYYLMKSVRW